MVAAVTDGPKEISSFRVIVVGAGVAGLHASRWFQKAGINHVVLQGCSKINIRKGAGIAVWPHEARILKQIGCLDAARAACKPGLRFKIRWSVGKLLFDNPLFDLRHREMAFTPTANLLI
ncbi:hypothetical protein GGR53DRAFT_359536 [Hypoxylon sp. FL1150]|nr:hypothetical protein GGR53DRAFT_359536 [Hypoxylon sp. FL1150]